jgi:hypothetical protein
MPLVRIGLTKSSTERVEILDIGFLDDRGERLLGEPSRLQGSRTDGK